MFEELLKGLEKPAIYEKTKVAFWDDEYISKQMLKAHLDPEMEAASRKMSFIDKSVKWIADLVPPSKAPILLDVGCGPGIYGEKFAKCGYQVTGIDFSKRSISYAKESAKKKGLSIAFLYQDYLKMKLDDCFDVATMIYCDYGALSTRDRHTIMQNVYDHVKPGGKFILDVFSTKFYDAFEEETTWEICNKGGFWREGPYVALNGKYKYPGNVTLSQTMISDEIGEETYYIWDTYFTKEMLTREANAVGFEVLNFFGDIAGKTFHDKSDTIAAVLYKPMK